MRKITAGLLAVLAAHDAIRRIFLFFSRSMWANAWTRKIGSLGGLGSWEPELRTVSLPCYIQASTEDSVLLTVDNASSKIKGSR